MKIIGLLFVASCACLGAPTYYPSGLLHTFEAEQTTTASSQRGAVDSFFSVNFPGQGKEFEWREFRSFSDSSHLHRYYELTYLGRRVVGHRLKIHYNWQGWVQYATSSWEWPLSALTSLPAGGVTKEELEQQTRSQLVGKYGYFQGTVRAEPVIWVTRDGTPIAALEVKVSGKDPLLSSDVIVDEMTGSELTRLKVVRWTADPTNKVFKISPRRNSDPETVTLTNLLEPKDKLSSSYLRVKREQYTQNPPDSRKSAERRDVDPSSDYTAVTGGDYPFDKTIDPPGNPTQPSPTDRYGYFCVGSGVTSCPNQSFDAVNVYYHLENYRSYVSTLFSTLGSTPSFPCDPLPVTVNVVSYETNGQPAANNAGVLGSCTANESPQMIFLRPAGGVSVGTCTNIDLLDVAREAVVAVHEYQHYVTDTIAGLYSYEDQDPPVVGDALHEGYSDYFAASQISRLTGFDATSIGDYAWQHTSSCPSLIRNVGVLTPYNEDNFWVTQITDNGPVRVFDFHLAGLPWASGLWQLRSELGQSNGVYVADLLALKSLFFLSTIPSFYEAVESLVKADKHLFNGEHVVRIRQLFYDELAFLGVRGKFFRDSGKGLVEMGFRSCAIHPRGTPIYSLSVCLFWLVCLLGLGRLRRL
ncbi:MAG: M36 family metallopeptidase [Deltaproteobacteria bacterium]|nr:M36 family metallopeptidase [Deltaproteobacteria bacterium]